MLTLPLIVARKEIRDHLRDTRSLVSSTFYALMGPLVVGMVSFATRGLKSSPVLLSMMSVFALVAAFVGGMNVAIDAIAGERERRSLLPLLMNPLLRRDVVLGKWLAISFFAVAGLILNLLGFAIVVALSPAQLLMVTLTLVPLALFASALELLLLPMAGQQILIDLLLKGGQIALLPLSALVITTLASTAAFLAIAARLLHHDDVVYGG